MEYPIHRLDDFHITDEQLEKLHIYQKNLLIWNQKTDLISKHDQEDLFSRHIKNCLNLLHLLDKQDQIIHDVGTGAGLPGIVCRICDLDPTRHYCLFEKKYQKRSFLKNMIVLLGLKNITIHEKYPDVSRETCDVLTSRALLSLQDMEKFRPYYKKFILFKGTHYHDEIKILNSSELKTNIKIYKASNDDSYLIVGGDNACFT